MEPPTNQKVKNYTEALNFGAPAKGDLNSLRNTRVAPGTVSILQAADLENNATSQPHDRTCDTYLAILAKVVAAVALSRAAVHSVVIVRVVRVLVGREVCLEMGCNLNI